MTNHKIFIAAATLALLVVGCNPNGYAHLGEKNDTTTRCQPGSTAWIRYSFDGTFDGEVEDGISPEEAEQRQRLVTELLILGHGVSAEDRTKQDCLYLAQFDYEGSMLLDQGDFELETGRPAEGEPYRGTWVTDFLYDFVRQPDLGILKRNGAKRTPYPLPEDQTPPSLPRVEPGPPGQLERQIAFYREGTELVLTVDGQTKRFQEFAPLLASLDPSDEDELPYFVRMANVGLLTSQVRVIGFGSGGMTGYKTAKNFDGLMDGTLRVGINVKLGDVAATLAYKRDCEDPTEGEEPTAGEDIVDEAAPEEEPVAEACDDTPETADTSSREGFSDVPGLVLEGPQLVDVSWGGDGEMAGEQVLKLFLTGEEAPFFAATLDYGGTTVQDGFGHSGNIPLTTEDGVTYDIAVEDALIVDFRGMPGLEPDGDSQN